MRRQQGFTLIELLVVIAIIGILATLVITQLGGATTKARNSSAQSDVTEVGKAIAVFANDDAASGRIIASNTAAVTSGAATMLLNGSTAGGAFASYFKGVQFVDTTAAGTTSTYAVSLAKTPSSLYTYKYFTDISTAIGALTSISSPNYTFCSNTQGVTGGAAAGSFLVSNTGTSTGTTGNC